MKKNITGITFEELETDIRSAGFPKYRAKQVFEWIHKKKKDRFEDMVNIGEELKAMLEEAYILNYPEAENIRKSEKDDTIKFLFVMRDGAAVESVFLNNKERFTVCVSSQAGCGCGCVFCATAKSGFRRDLESGEIIGQIYAVEKYTGRKMDNIVFMGMGEPLCNWENLRRAIMVMGESRGRCMSFSRMTLSTVGVVPGIRELADNGPAVNLAVSLITTDEKLRRKLVPYTAKYGLNDIKEASLYYNKKTGRLITYEYILFKGLNDSIADAHKTLGFLKGIKYKMNLIPYNNAGNNEFRPAERERALEFQKVFVDKGIKTFLRREKGTDISAACGQLAGYSKKKNEKTGQCGIKRSDKIKSKKTQIKK
ncbi:MAG: 23S rRNA (adenine(2503)-C(2))-methyltransferase RlmN [Candidatus Goldiibacteriota bacterium]